MPTATAVVTATPHSESTRIFATLVTALLLVAPPAHAQPTAATPITDAVRRGIVDSTARFVGRYYFSTETGASLERSLRARAQRGVYDTVKTAEGLARALSEDLQRDSRDLHLRVIYSADAIPPRQGPPGDLAVEPPESRERRRRMHGMQNFGISAAQRLAGNIGYLDLRGFADPIIAGPTVAAAMTLIGSTDALIIDLRENRGGEPEMVQFLASYFFDLPVRLTDLVARNPAETVQHWTLPFVPGPRYVGKEVFLLTGRKTFSAAEAFAYIMQARGRAKLVGIQTGGGTNPADGYPIDQHFAVIVPYARPLDPRTGANWQDGVRPDVSTAEADALNAAHAEALRAVQRRLGQDPLAAERAQALAQLEGSRPRSGTR